MAQGRVSDGLKLGPAGLGRDRKARAEDAADHASEALIALADAKRPSEKSYFNGFAQDG